jgi:hypothetical protein
MYFSQTKSVMTEIWKNENVGSIALAGSGGYYKIVGSRAILRSTYHVLVLSKMSLLPCAARSRAFFFHYGPHPSKLVLFICFISGKIRDYSSGHQIANGCTSSVTLRWCIHGRPIWALIPVHFGACWALFFKRDNDDIPVRLHTTIRRYSCPKLSVRKKGSVWTFITRISYQCMYILLWCTNRENKNFENFFLSSSKFLFSRSVNQTNIQLYVHIRLHVQLYNVCTTVSYSCIRIQCVHSRTKFSTAVVGALLG